MRVLVYENIESNVFDIHNRMKQGCVLAPALFNIYFSFLLLHTVTDSSDGIYLQTRLDGGLCLAKHHKVASEKQGEG